MDAPTPTRIGAVDIGATTVKVGVVDPSGDLLDAVTKLDTPRPCSPQQLVALLVAWLSTHALDFASIGFPGELADGVVVAPGNLARHGGADAVLDEEVQASWPAFHLEEAVGAALDFPVAVVNDAALAAYGCSEGTGRELMLTLGTGLGIALLVDGQAVRIRDVGAEPFHGLGTCDTVLGEAGRAHDEARWHEHLAMAVEQFGAEFAADVVHLGGGNARLVHTAEFDHAGPRVTIHTNEQSLVGAARLFAVRTGTEATTPR